MPWLAASRSARRASGSWTFQSSWRLVEPADVAASRTVGGDRPDAGVDEPDDRRDGVDDRGQIAVNRLGANRASAGIR